MAQRYVKAWTDRAIGHCNSCGDSLRGEGIDAGPGLADCICVQCGQEISDLMAQRAAGTAVTRAKKSGHREAVAR